MYWRLLVALVLLSATMALPADQTDPRLNDLFEQLSDAPDETAARDTANAIWKIWFESRDPESTKLLQEAVEAKQAGDYTLALDTINKVLARSPDFAEAWNQRAIIYYNVGYYDASLADVEQTLKLEPRHFGALSGRGMCYLGLKDAEEALLAFEEALEVHPWLSAARTYANSLREAVELRRRRGV